MSAELLDYYERELSYIRHLAGQFAEEHPKIARRLVLGKDGSADPHVERLLEGFAYLTARIRKKLDDEFPEITESLLGVLYPHYQAPLPSLAIARFELDPEQKELTDGYPVERHSALETDTIDGEPVRFRTCYPVALWPIDVTEASLELPPFKAPAAPFAHRAAAVLRLTLRCRSAKLPFAELSLDTLRLFLHGQPQHVYRLYELIFNNALGVALAASAQDPRAVLLDKSALHHVGFGPDDGVLPYGPRSFLGYRLLSEFFAFPQKFLFVDLTGLKGKLPAEGNQLEIFIYLNRGLPDLKPNIRADTFQLGCAPIVNLYKQRAEPIRLTQTEYEYRVVPDARRPLAHEIYTVDRVTAQAPDGQQEEYQPFFSVKHAAAAAERFWHASRRPAEREDGRPDGGTEVFVALVDLGLRPSVAGGWTVDVETTCLNRDLPAQLPFGGGDPRLELVEGGGPVKRVSCLTKPTLTLRPALKRGALWRLVSHLSLNHLSLVNGDGGADALREILRIYDFADSAQTRKIIEGVLSVESGRHVGRVNPSTFARGVKVTVDFDPEKYTGAGLFLFACVLEHFFGLYCSMNSFSKMVARVKGAEEVLREWPPRLGERVLI
jgi:type VI secretion system protein ImpG